MLEEPLSVTIGIPTINSSQYIYHSLTRIRQQMADLPPTIRVELVLCVNGTSDGGKSVLEIQRFAANHRELTVQLYELPSPGKNRALNTIIEHAKREGSDILHFFDDDVDLAKGSLRANIEALLAAQAQARTPILVGSNFIGIQHPIRHFISREKSVLKGVKCWLLHWIFVTPFLPESDKPRFCIGQSLGAFTATFPLYPDDSTGIADDGFIGNHYAVLGKKDFLERGFNPIVKPEASVVYFEIATSYREWLRQQVRILVGVYYSYLMFDEELEFFNDFFAWEYSIGEALRRAGPTRGIVHLVRRGILRLLQRRVMRRSMELIRTRNIADWSPARSTKPDPASQAAA